HYRELGDGPPLLLVHGLMTASYSWRYVAPKLAETYRVIVPDLPGAGGSDKVIDATYSLSALATWVGEFMDALGIRGERCIGNSLGGLICMRLALDEPTSFSKLVNVHSPCFPEARYFALQTALQLWGVKSILAKVVRRDPLRWVHKNVHYWDESLKSIEEAHAYGDPLAEKNGAEAFIHYLSDAITPEGTHRISDDLLERKRAGQAFPVPLLLLYANDDPMVSPDNGRRLAKVIPDAKTVWVGKTSHFMHVDTPEPFLEAVLPFLGD
ncbi:MAG TPA: alpha/beta hydrolase, partial [Polyangiaceae bacterium]